MGGQPYDGPDADELTRLQAEVSRLRGVLDVQRRHRSRAFRVRRVVAGCLVVLAAFGAVASVIGLWGARTTLNTDRWVATVGPLPRDPEVADAVSTYVTEELVAVLDVEDRIAEALPPRAAFLAGATTGAVTDYVRRTVDEVLQSPQFQEVWVGINRVAHEQIVDVLENRGDVISTTGDAVTLDLLPVVNNVLSALEQRVPSLFGKNVDLPEITSGEVPPGLQDRIELALGVQLPDDFAAVTIYSGDQVGALQDAVREFERYLALLVVGTLAALALALWISPARRRTTLQVGVWLVIVTVALSAILRAVRSQILENLPEGTYRDGADAAVTTVFSTLRDRGDQLLALGVGLALVAYLAGPGRGAGWVRRQAVGGWRAAVRGSRWVASESGGRPWVRANLDPLRIGGVAVAALVAVLLSSWGSLAVVLVLLAGYEAVVTLLASGGPPPPEPEPEAVALPEPRREPERRSPTGGGTPPAAGGGQRR